MTPKASGASCVRRMVSGGSRTKLRAATETVQRLQGAAENPCMSTKPRRVVPGVTYLVTRRCSERRFFLHPDPQVTWNFEYLLGVLAAKYGVEVHAYVVMSNHYHLVVTDVQGVMPDFQRELNSLLARSVNAFRGRREPPLGRDLVMCGDPVHGVPLGRDLGGSLISLQHPLRS
jgi:REP element-mobilizing transposase RayT